MILITPMQSIVKAVVKNIEILKLKINNITSEGEKMKKLLMSFVLLLLSYTILTAQGFDGDSLNASIIGRWNNSGSANDVAVNGNYAYVADGLSGLRIIDISTPSLPVEVGFWDTDGYTLRVTTDGNYAYISDSGEGLRIIDISTPSAPSEVGFYKNTSQQYSGANGAFVRGNYVYLIYDVQGMFIIDVSTPSTPVEVGHYQTNYTAQSITVDGSYAYIGQNYTGFDIVDITTPSVPTKVGNFNSSANILDIAVKDNYAYIANQNSGFKIIDVSSKTAPVEVGSFSTPYSNNNLAVDGGYAYLAVDNWALQIIDISDKTSPNRVGYYNTTAQLHGLTFANNSIFAAGEDSGLFVFKNELLSPGASSTLNGKVTNAVDGTAISGALVEIAGLSTITDASGNYEITDIPEATLNAAFSGTPLSGTSPLEVSFTDQSNDAAHSLVVSATDFSTYTNNQVVIASGETLTMDVSLSPTLATGEMRIVLNWGNAPDDLDSYLKTPAIEGSEYEIYFSNKGEAASAPYAVLDIDDRDAFGPETITIYKKFTGTYKYYVHNYSSTPDITTSNAVVQVYNSSGLVTSVNVPTSGVGKYWNVLTVDGTTGEVSIVNEIIESTPTSTIPIMPTKSINLAKIEMLQRGTESITSRAWNFGDGATSTEKNPTHTYTAEGDYTVTLTVSNGTDNDIETKTNYISVTAPASGDTIYSTTAGGNWEDTLTWIGNQLPTADDNVVIQGTVIANAHYGDAFECKSLTLRDSLKCTDDGNYDYVTLTIFEDLINNGTITYGNYGSGFTIFAKGDIINNGIFEPYLVRLDGNSAQTISGTAPIGVGYFEIMNGQDIIAGSDLNFVDIGAFNIDPYGGMKKHVNFIIPEDKVVSFIWESSNFTTDINKIDFKGGGTIFSKGDVRFIDSTTFSNVKLTGLIQMNDNAKILDNVALLDTLQNASNNYGASIVIEEDFTNNGFVRTNANCNHDFHIYAKKNIVNKGAWKINYMVMDGTSDQTFTNKGELASSFELKANVNSATTFQWFKDGVEITGATNETYEISSSDIPYGEYYCQTNAGNSRKIIIKKENGGEEGGIILEEKFDTETFPPNGWTQIATNTNNTWKKGNPSDNNFSSIDPTNVYSAVCPFEAIDQDEWLKSPVVALPNEAILLEFYAGYSTNWLTAATIKVNISTDGGSNWTKVWEAVNDGGDWGWRGFSIDLSAYKNNSNVMLAWQYVGNDGDLASLDNIKLTYGTVDVEDAETVEIPTKYALNQNYPNPFNPTTIISYALPKEGMVTLNIYNILGEKVAELVNEMQNAGSYKVNFDASKLSTGAYIYRIQAGSFVQTKKMLLIK